MDQLQRKQQKRGDRTSGRRGAGAQQAVDQLQRKQQKRGDRATGRRGTGAQQAVDQLPEGASTEAV